MSGHYPDNEGYIGAIIEAVAIGCRERANRMQLSIQLGFCLFFLPWCILRLRDMLLSPFVLAF